MEKESKIAKKANSSWKKVFLHAIDGCEYAFTTQRNFKIHFLLSFSVLILAAWLKISFEKFLLLVIAIFFGLTVEMGNTVFEKTVDLITNKFDPKAKIAKDVAAGMMLVASAGLATLGFLILFPPLWQKITIF